MIRRFLTVVIAVCSAYVPSIGASADDSADPFSVRWEPAEIAVTPDAAFQSAVALHAPPGHYVYADEVDVDFVSLEGIHIDEIAFPEPQREILGDDGREKAVYQNDTRIVIRGAVPGGIELGPRKIIARVDYQGCTKNVCYRPRSRAIELAVSVGRGPHMTDTEPRPAPAQRAETSWIGDMRALLATQDFSLILNRGVLWTLALVFLAGILTSLTPCIWPVLPVTLLVIGVEKQHSIARNFLLALSLVAGLVIVYAVLGVAAVAMGRNLGFVFQQRWFIVLVVVFFVVLALSLFGVFDIHLSHRWADRLHRLGGKGFRGAFLSGLGLGLIASPCTGPVIAALLAYVALRGSYALGFGLLVVYAVGMGIFIVVVGALYGMVADRLRGGAWMQWIKRALGVLLLIPAAFYVGVLLNPAGEPPAVEGPTVAWITNAAHGLAFAEREGRPVIVDFYADWCPPCRRLDQRVFSDPAVVRLSYAMIPVRVDATYESPRVRALFDHYQIMGLPTVIFLAPDGTEYRDLRVVAADPSRVENNMEIAVERAAQSAGAGGRK